MSIATPEDLRAIVKRHAAEAEIADPVPGEQGQVHDDRAALIDLLRAEARELDVNFDCDMQGRQHADHCRKCRARELLEALRS